MARRRSERKTTEAEPRHAGIKWAEGAGPSSDAGEMADPADMRDARRAADRAYLERVFGVAHPRSPRPYAASRSITRAERLRAIRLATTHPTVTPHLAGRWEVLGCDEIWAKHLLTSTRQVVRVYLFNYTTNRLYEVTVQDDRVTAVEPRGIHEYPESPGEMAMAIELARGDPLLGPEVWGLDGHAILRPSTLPDDPSTKRRCMWVMFTEPEEPARQMPTRHTALVDMTTLTVVAHSAAPAPEAAR
jgi:hypothetical protein